jgi:predicted AlkP superfamily phosphohydrolase/phosphomutase
MDQAGYIRINLRGRESQGVVEPGADYNNLCNELTRYLYSLKDADNGKAVVARVIPAWKQALHDAPARDVLPDLVVVWSDIAASRCRRLLSDQLPGFDFKVPQYNVSGRSGNHAGYGWFVADGPGLVSKGPLQGHTIRDLAPSVFHALGATLPTWFESRNSIWRYGKTAESADDS